MDLEEIFEHGISIAKTVWRKRGNDISRHEVERLIATDIKPRKYVEIADSEGNR